MSIFTKTFVRVLLVFVVFSASAQDEGFIYGKVYTIDNKVYEGPIRWGKEEVYWTDIFNAGKERNQNLRYLSSRDRDRLDDRQNTWSNWNNGNWYRWFGNWGNDRNNYNNNNYDNDYEHQFACQFGEIKTIIPAGRKYVDLEMQNGDKISLKGEGYNDVGEEIRIMDPEMGELDMSWGRIRKIEFMKTPKTLSNRFGTPLYGKVEAFGETFTGYIQWDHDERLSTDKLDGDADDGNISLEFSKIVSIERRGGRSSVKMKSGRELVMDGSNDVDSGNRGIIIMSKEMIAIDVPWREFDKVTFSEPSGSLATYDQFVNQKSLSGSVVTKDGKTLTGKIVFDLDEEFNYELLQGKQGDFEVITPFRDIKIIEPISDYRCNIELKSGKKIRLDDAQDVNERNQGVLIFADNKGEPSYLLWEDVKTIEFN